MYTQQQADLVSAYGQFIMSWPWDHYATLTFARKLSPANCLRHWNDFVHSLGCTTRARVGWVRVDEQRTSGVGNPAIALHYHALLTYKHVPPAQTVAALWKAKAGDSLVEDYRSGGGAAFYIAKMIPYDGANYDFGGLEYFDRVSDTSIHGLK
jgi:hypothetical protein